MKLKSYIYIYIYIYRACLLGLFIGVAVFVSGCATPNPYGTWYTNVKAPLSAVVGDTKFSKVGTATCTNILGVVATGDCSIEAAAKSAGITKVKIVDHEATSILGFYGKYTTIVKGD